MSKAPILVLTGPSGSGKTTLCNYLVAHHGFVQPKTCTTRKPRTEESNDAYIFLDREEFEKKISNREMAEYVESFGNYYGSPVSSFNKDTKIAISLNQKGAHAIKSMYPDRTTIVMLSISKEIMLQRILARSQIEEEQLAMRLRELDELQTSVECDYLINSNQPIDSVTKTIDEIVTKLPA